MKPSGNRFSMVCKKCGCHYEVRAVWRLSRRGSITAIGCKACGLYKKCNTVNNPYTLCDVRVTKLTCPICEQIVSITKHHNDRQRPPEVEIIDPGTGMDEWDNDD